MPLDVTRADVLTAFRRGNLTQLKQWHAEGRLQTVADKDARTWRPHEIAAAYGHLNILKWFVEESDQEIDLTAFDNRIFRRAAEYGHLEVVKWLFTECPQKLTFSEDNNSTLRWVAANGHLAVLKWFIKDSGLPVDITADNNAMVYLAAGNGHLEVVQWLLLHSGQKVDVTADANAVIFNAAQQKRFAVVEWLLFESESVTRILLFSQKWQADLPPTLRASVEELRAAHVALQLLRTPLHERAKYLQSTVCRKALVAGVVADREHLESLRSSMSTRTKTVRPRL